MPDLHLYKYIVVHDINTWKLPEYSMLVIIVNADRVARLKSQYVPPRR